MYRNRKDPSQVELQFVDFKSPFGEKLRADNRWVRLSEIIPWDSFEEEYSSKFGTTGNPAIPFRVALGSLIIKERCNFTDEDTVEHIHENPYLQYFVGFTQYSEERPFNPSMMTYFRKRISSDMLCAINEKIVLKNEDKREDDDCDDDIHDDEPRKGKMIIDATCVPEDIRYPTDASLLNEARELTERVIDILWAHHPHRNNVRKPRTYRQLARKHFCSFIKLKRPSRKRIRKEVKTQLQYVKRNLKTINTMKSDVPLTCLDTNLYRKLLVIHELYRQQSEHFKSIGKKNRSIRNRIVSISKPHVRPIVRGKASGDTEFGAKISVSLIDGKMFLDRLSWDAFNEGGDLISQSKAYRRRTGFYPESIHADKIYRNRENLRWCKSRNIRLSGSPLGRPSKDLVKNKLLKKLIREDEGVRNAVEGAFGVCKRRYGLSRLLTKLKSTSETTVALIILAINLGKILKDLFVFIFKRMPELVITVFRNSKTIATKISRTDAIIMTN